MATDQASPPEGMESFDGTQTGESDNEIIDDLEPGGVLDGILLELEEDTNDHGPYWTMKIKDSSRGLVWYYAHDSAKAACSSGYVSEGDRVWIHREPETETATIDGDEIEYNPTTFYSEEL